jgi:ribosomal protein L37E
VSPSSVPPPSAPPPSAPPQAHAGETVACAACGQAFDFRSPDCPRCGFPQAAALPKPASAAPAKNPRTAMWWSLCWPGAGHLYARDTERAAIFLAVSAVLTLGSVTFLSVPVVFVLWLGVALYAAIDSGQAASGSRGR